MFLLPRENSLPLNSSSLPCPPHQWHVFTSKGLGHLLIMYFCVGRSGDGTRAPTPCCCILPAPNRHFPERFPNSNEWESQREMSCTLYMCMCVHIYTYTQKSRQTPRTYVCVYIYLYIHKYKPEVILEHPSCSPLAGILFPIFLCSVFSPQQPRCRGHLQRWAALGAGWESDEGFASESFWT